MPPDVRTGGGVNHLSTFDADLRNVSFAMITFMGFPAILSANPMKVIIAKLTFLRSASKVER